MAVGHIIDSSVIQNGSVLRTAVVFFYLSNEWISILENAFRIGLPVPEKLKAVPKQLREEKDEQSGQEGPLDKEEWDLKDRASAGKLVFFCA